MDGKGQALLGIEIEIRLSPGLRAPESGAVFTAAKGRALRAGIDGPPAGAEPERMARVLLRDWVEEGLLEIAEPGRRNRAYRLSASYRQFIGNQRQ